jgi:radical SAM protein with 4Fe4S-binding SPASM domain
MCRFQISIGWDGTLYDCDFNQAVGLSTADGFPNTINDLEIAHLQKRAIATDEHCFGCTAGAGSSCGGALLE